MSGGSPMPPSISPMNLSVFMRVFPINKDMTLPFDREYPYTSFHRRNTDFQEFKTHILDEHDEGREYVICPLQRCATPLTEEVNLPQYSTIHRRLKNE